MDRLLNCFLHSLYKLKKKKLKGNMLEPSKEIKNKAKGRL